MYFLAHFHGWTLEGEAIIVLFHLYLCNFWLRKTRVLQSSLGFLWTHVLMVCFLNVLVSFVMWFISFLYCCTLNKWSVKVWIHASHALLLNLFNFHVFYCLKGIQSHCLLSLAPHLSFLIIHLKLRHQYCFLPRPKEPPAETVSNPRTQNCNSSICHQKTLKIPNQPF